MFFNSINITCKIKNPESLIKLLGEKRREMGENGANWGILGKTVN
jgi:hypothetical protein